MRLGQASGSASGLPICPEFFQHFSPSIGCNISNNNVQCCLYDAISGDCGSSDWSDSIEGLTWDRSWDGKESISSGDEIGMLLDLDEGVLSVYKNGRKLGVMERGLAGPYHWVVSMYAGNQVTIKRGTIPPS